VSDEQNDDRQRRAQRRRETWTVQSLSDQPPEPPATFAERLELLEQLRRAAFALAGVEYPEGPTPKHERQAWPIERIG
jgi:hypothetical protein